MTKTVNGFIQLPNNNLTYFKIFMQHIYLFYLIYQSTTEYLFIRKDFSFEASNLQKSCSVEKRSQNDKTYGVLQKTSYKTLKNEIMCNTNTKCNHQWSQSFCYWRFISSLDVWEADLTGKFSSRYQGMQERKRLIPRQVWPIPLCFTDTSAAECRLICTISVDNIPCYIDT